MLAAAARQDEEPLADDFGAPFILGGHPCLLRFLLARLGGRGLDLRIVSHVRSRILHVGEEAVPDKGHRPVTDA